MSRARIMQEGLQLVRFLSSKPTSVMPYCAPLYNSNKGQQLVDSTASGVRYRQYSSSTISRNVIMGPKPRGKPRKKPELGCANVELHIEAVEDELSRIVGMSDLKLQLRNWAKVLQMDLKRKALGNVMGKKKTPHMAFLGGPGTGKTMVARVLGRLLHKVGIVPTEKVVEVQRADLIGQYVGHTEEKTRKMIEKAKGGILFVDEAYRLVPSESECYDDETFGRQALEEIMSVMESGEIVVIFAGYEEPMKRVISANQGFSRRVTKIFTFADYSPKDLVEIVEENIRKQTEDSPFFGFKLHPSCSREAITNLIERDTTEELRSKLNGGLAELMLVNAQEKLDLRLDFKTAGSEDLFTITLEDLENGLHSLVTSIYHDACKNMPLGF